MAYQKRYLGGILAVIMVSLLLMFAGKTYANNVALNSVRLCIKNKTGSLRAILPTKGCSSNESVFDINKTISSTVSTTSTIQHTDAFIDNLAGADFSNMDLRYRSFVGRDLTNAIFLYTNMTSVDLTGTNLSGANLSHLNLDSVAGISSANLTGTDFTNSSFNVVDLSGKDLSTTNFKGAFLYGAKLQHVNLSGHDLTGTDLESADLTDADLTNVKMDINSSMNAANLTNTNLKGISNFPITDTTYYPSPIYNNTTCPDGTNSDSHDNSCEGHF